MTLRTIETGMPARQRKEGMIDGGRCPGRGAVTLLAALREVQRNMIGRPLVVGIMAGVAVGWQAGIDTARMTLRAGCSGMGPRQRKCRVVERGRRPPRCAVALLAGLRIGLCQMVRRTVEVSPVTGSAIA